MAPNVEHVKLNPPLPWAASDGTAGAVVGINPSMLQLDAPLSEGCESIRIRLPNGQWRTLKGRSGMDTPLAFAISDPEDRRTLQDLLHQVRKDQHIELCARQDVEASDRKTGFEDLYFLPESLPELDFDDLDTSASFLGRTFRLPLLITGMTGGIEKGAEINRRLARAAAALDIPMGIGSQRMALENPELAPIFAVKKYAPRVFLIGNLGCSQLLKGDALDMGRRSVEMIEADALAVHLNILQECVQIEGDRHFKGILPRIETLARSLEVPVIVKEVGCGISPATARRLKEAGVQALDVGGRGGTSWGYIEGLRARSPETLMLAQSFRDWGIPTAQSLAAVRRALPDMPLVATGGIRDGLTAAKALGLGAKLAGIGLPLLRAALEDEDGPLHVLKRLERELKTTMLLAGVARVDALGTRLRRGLPHAADLDALLSQLNS